MNYYICHNQYTLLIALSFIKINNEKNFLIYAPDSEQKINEKALSEMSNKYFFSYFIDYDFYKDVSKNKFRWRFYKLYTYKGFYKVISNIYSDDKLFVFNDEVKVSRYFIDFFESYSLIQEGMANYLNISKTVEIKCKIINTIPFIRKINLPLGRDQKCKTVIYIENNSIAIPSDILNKSLLCFIDFSVFDFSEINSLFFNSIHHVKSDVLIVTQPIECYSIKLNDKLDIYFFIASLLRDKSIKCSFKLHPRESLIEYENFDDISYGYPLQLLKFIEPNIITLSLYSSSELGFKDIRIFNSSNEFETYMNKFNMDFIKNKIENAINENFN